MCSQCGNDDEHDRPSVIELSQGQREHVARKRHTCDTSPYHQIEPGERYRERVLILDGEFTVLREHADYALCYERDREHRMIEPEPYVEHPGCYDDPECCMGFEHDGPCVRLTDHMIRGDAR